MAQLALHPEGQSRRLPDSSAYSKDVADADRDAIRAALKSVPFKLPNRLQSRVLAGDNTPLLVAGVESLRATHSLRNLILAKGNFELAANRGDPRGLLAMAALHGNGWGVPRDLRHAREYLGKLRNVNYPRAICVQAELDARLPGGNSARTIRDAFLAGASGGDAYCQNLMGIHYEQAGNVSKATEYYRQAGAQGHEAALQNLTRLDTKAFSLFEQSYAVLRKNAEAGDPLSQFELARRFHVGVGVPIDYRQALIWYSRASNRHPPSRHVLALFSERNPDDQTGTINSAVMADIAKMPIVAEVSLLPQRAPVVRDPDFLAGIEGLPVEPYARRLREASVARAGGPSQASDVVPPVVAPQTLVDSRGMIIMTTGQGAPSPVQLPIGSDGSTSNAATP